MQSRSTDGADTADRGVVKEPGESGISGPTAQELGAVGFRCEICRRRFRPRHRLHWDHRFPQSWEESRRLSNDVRLVHAVCNIRRHTARKEGGVQQLLLTVPVSYHVDAVRPPLVNGSVAAGEVCPSCGITKPSLGTLKVRAWRSWKKQEAEDALRMRKWREKKR